MAALLAVAATALQNLHAIGATHALSLCSLAASSMEISLSLPLCGCKIKKAKDSFHACGSTNYLL